MGNVFFFHLSPFTRAADAVAFVSASIKTMSAFKPQIDASYFVSRALFFGNFYFRYVSARKVSKSYFKFTLLFVSVNKRD